MPRNTTALALVRSECANYRIDGTCLGADLWGRFCVPLPWCLVTRGVPCSYFERCLLPLTRKKGSWAAAQDDYMRRAGGSTTAALAKVTDERLREALSRHPFAGHHETFAQTTQKNVRRCACGAPLERRKQLCPTCRRKRRRQQYRRQKQRQRATRGV